MSEEVNCTEVEDWNDVLEELNYKLVLIMNQNGKDQNTQGR